MYHIINDSFVCKDTDTQGEHTYVVAMACGGVMEDPDIHYENYQLIRANNSREAVEKYNRINSCWYYYGHVMTEVF